MIETIVPQFFTTNVNATLSYYEDLRGIEIQFIYGEPGFYARVTRDGLSIFFRVVDSTKPEKKI